MLIILILLHFCHAEFYAKMALFGTIGTKYVIPDLKIILILSGQGICESSWTKRQTPIKILETSRKMVWYLWKIRHSWCKTPQIQFW